MKVARVHGSLLLPVVLVCLALNGFAATFTANPILDAFVTIGPTGNLADNNYGGAGALSIAAPGSPNGEFQSVMRYDLAAARASFDALFGSGQWVVQSVTLQLTAQSPNNPIFNPAVAGSLAISWMQNDGWTEGTGSPSTPGLTGITYNSLINTFINNSLDQNLGSLSYNGLTSGSFSGALALSPGLLGDIQSGDLLSLRLFAGDTSMSGVFPSRSFGTASSRPLLMIDVAPVPEPSAIALGVLGLLCVAGHRLFRRAR